MSRKTRKAAGIKSGGCGRARGKELRGDRVAAFAVFGLGGNHGEPHLLAQRAGDKAAYGMSLPSGSIHQGLQLGMPNFLFATTTTPRKRWLSASSPPLQAVLTRLF